MRQNVQRERRHRTRWRAPLAVCGFACVLIAQAGEMPGYPPPPGSYPVGRLPAAAAEVAPSAAPSKDSRPSGAPATDGPAYGPGTPDLATRLFGASTPARRPDGRRHAAHPARVGTPPQRFFSGFQPATQTCRRTVRGFGGRRCALPDAVRLSARLSGARARARISQHLPTLWPRWRRALSRIPDATR